MSIIDPKVEERQAILALIGEYYQKFANDPRPWGVTARQVLSEVRERIEARGYQAPVIPGAPPEQNLMQAAGRHPQANTRENLASPRQQSAIRAIAWQAKLDPEAACQELLGCKTGDLSRRAASAFIDFLKTKAVELSEGKYQREHFGSLAS